METIGLIFGIIVFIISIGLIKLVRSLIKLMQYIIKAREDGKIDKNEEKIIMDLAKDVTENLIEVIFKGLSSKVNKNTKAKDVIEKMKSK
jgi:hypothetical protein